MLPWLEATIAGTTDSSAEITMRPQPSEEEIRFILDSIAEYLTVKVRCLACMPRSVWCTERCSATLPWSLAPHCRKPLYT